MTKAKAISALECIATNLVGELMAAGEEPVADVLRQRIEAVDLAQRALRELDAAVDSWRGFCSKCVWNGEQYLSDGKMDDRCKTCRENNKCNWQWRGVKEE